MAENTRFVIGDDLEIVMVDLASLKEQDLNAQVMQPRHFDRLTENIRNRGQVESLPYCHQPEGKGPVSIVSGHHRARAAHAAGLAQIPVILDKKPMARSEIIAKQIAHNELHGDPDEEILRQLVDMIDNVDDLLTTGLPEDWMPTVDKDDTALLMPHAEFDWRLVTLTFLPAQLQQFEDIVRLIDSHTDLIGVADRDQFEAFSQAVVGFGRTQNIKSMATALLHLARLAREHIAAATDPETTPTADIGLVTLPTATADKIQQIAKDTGRTTTDVITAWAEAGQ